MNEGLIEKLQSLSGKSSAAKLKTIMPVIDAQIKRGVSHDDVIATLAEAGVVVNKFTFRSALYAYRRKLRQVGEASHGLEAHPVHDPVPASHGPGIDSDVTAEDPLDTKVRDSLGEQYLSRRKPIIRG